MPILHDLLQIVISVLTPVTFLINTVHEAFMYKQVLTLSTESFKVS